MRPITSINSLQSCFMSTVNRISLHTFHIDIVHGCQLRCVGCPNSTIMDKVKRVDLDVFRQCLGNVDVENIQYLRLFNFGEPLLHTNLTGIFQIIKEQPWRAEELEVSTNAQWCDWDDLEKALALGVLDRLVVSCDGDGTPEQYERLRPPGKWDKLIEFLDRVSEMQGRVAPNLKLITRSIIENEEGMERWEAITQARGWTAEFRDWKMLPEAEKNLTGRVLKVPHDVCSFAAPPDYFQQSYHGKLYQLYVDADGTVVPCCAHPSAGNLGNLRHSKVSELMVNTERKNFVRRLQTDRKNTPVCNACEFGPPDAPGESFSQLNKNKPATPETVEIIN